MEKETISLPHPNRRRAQLSAGSNLIRPVAILHHMKRRWSRKGLHRDSSDNTSSYVVVLPNSTHCGVKGQRKHTSVDSKDIHGSNPQKKNQDMEMFRRSRHPVEFQSAINLARMVRNALDHRIPHRLVPPLCKPNRKSKTSRGKNNRTVLLSILFLMLTNIDALRLQRSFVQTTTTSPSISLAPTHLASASPTNSPTTSHRPTTSFSPSSTPTISISPSTHPTASPTKTPTFHPTPVPTFHPTPVPTFHPTPEPTSEPTRDPSLSPSITESSTPTLSFQPTESPTAKPSITSSISPTVSFAPTPVPSANPTISPSALPSLSSAPSSNPTSKPSSSPSSSPTISSAPTSVPSSKPSSSPSSSPTISSAPTTFPSLKPSSSPTGRPTVSPTDMPSTAPTHHPSPSPTISFQPTFQPTSSPSVSPTDTPSFSPTMVPSVSPTVSPSYSPTSSPTSQPTYSETIIKYQVYVQRYIGEELNVLDAAHQRFYMNALTSYTTNYGECEIDAEFPKSCSVTTTCLFLEQETSFSRRLFKLFSFKRNEKQTVSTLRVKFEMSWSSKTTDIETMEYDEAFKAYMNSETGKRRTKDVMNAWGIGTVNDVENLQTVNPIPPSPPPTIKPTASPTLPPTPVPIFSRSYQPSSPSTSSPSTSSPSTSSPSTISSGQPALPTDKLLPPFEKPSSNPVLARNPLTSIPAIVGICAASVFVFSLLIYFLKRKKKSRHTNTMHMTSMELSRHSYHSRKIPHYPLNVDAAVPMRDSPKGSLESEQYSDEYVLQPNESLISNQSLISIGYSMDSESLPEIDSTGVFADEFEEYLDPDLESVRIDVAQKVTDSEEMISQALTAALLMDDEEKIQEYARSKWGGKGNGMEIEASVLCDTNDWLKRKEMASMEDRKTFLQEEMNTMVACVRHTIVTPEDASRTIHECAAMLGMTLAEDIPETTVIVTGMRKTVEREDVKKAFEEFGEIEDAAVAPNSRGFGLVRFRSPRSVQKALKKCRVEEIIVQDVGVMVRVFNHSQHGISRPDHDTRKLPPSAPGSARQLESTGMAAHHSTNLDSIGYANDSFGAQSPRFGKASSSRDGSPIRQTGSEDGRSVQSRDGRSVHSRDGRSVHSRDGRSIHSRNSNRSRHSRDVSHPNSTGRRGRRNDDGSNHLNPYM